MIESNDSDLKVFNQTLVGRGPYKFLIGTKEKSWTKHLYIYKSTFLSSVGAFVVQLVGLLDGQHFWRFGDSHNCERFLDHQFGS